MLQHNQINTLLTELLYKHNCVIVPNFGGFVAREDHAHFSKGDNLLYPPSKHLLFNKNLIHNDGLLISALMEKNNILFEEASKQIEDYKNYLQSILFAKKRFELPQIGLLYIDAENSIRFEAKVDMNFLLNTFGLEPVIANPLALENVNSKISVFEDRLPVNTPIAKRKRSSLQIAATIIAIPVTLGFLLFAASTKPIKPLLESSFNPFYSPESYYHPNHRSSRQMFLLDKETIKPLLTDANGYATYKLSNHSPVLVATTNETKKDKTTVTSNHFINHPRAFGGAFQVVVGCFGIENNAKKMVRELSKNNLNAGISGLNAKGLHVVSCGGFDTKEEAANLLATIKQEFPQAWIMVK